MSNYTEQQANETLTNILESQVSEFNSLAESSRNELIDALQPGEKLPDKNVIHDQRRQLAFMESSRERRGEARAAVQSVLDEYIKAEAAAPSTEAVNSITLLRGRRHVTEQEINDLMTIYGGNMQAARAIADIAQEHKIRVTAPNSMRRRADIEALGQSIDRALSEKTVRPGLLSFVKAQLDSIIPPGE